MLILFFLFLGIYTRVDAYLDWVVNTINERKESLSDNTKLMIQPLESLAIHDRQISFRLIFIFIVLFI